jgi:uncharacterized iron-regulated membrane protein
MVEPLIALAVLILIVGLVAGLVVWLIRAAPFIEEPFKSGSVWLVYVVAVLIILAKALPLIGVNVL